MSSLIEAVRARRPDDVATSLDHAGERDDQGRTALMLAACFGYLDCLSPLITREAGLHDAYGLTAMMFAAGSSNGMCCTLLLEREAGLRAAPIGSALDLAMRNGYFDIASILAAEKGMDGLTEPMRAALTGRAIDVAQYSNTFRSMHEGYSALMLAACCNNLPVVDALVEHESGLRNSQGATALMLAAKYGSCRVLSTLLKYEEGLQDDAGQTALMYAIAHGRVECAQMLSSEAGKQTGHDIWLLGRMDAGTTALMLAAESGLQNIVEVLTPLEVGLKTRSGLTAYKYALRRGNREALASLEAEVPGELKSHSGQKSNGASNIMLLDTSKDDLESVLDEQSVGHFSTASTEADDIRHKACVDALLFVVRHGAIENVEGLLQCVTFSAEDLDAAIEVAKGMIAECDDEVHDQQRQLISILSHAQAALTDEAAPIFNISNEGLTCDKVCSEVVEREIETNSPQLIDAEVQSTDVCEKIEVATETDMEFILNSTELTTQLEQASSRIAELERALQEKDKEAANLTMKMRDTRQQFETFREKYRGELQILAKRQSQRDSEIHTLQDALRKAEDALREQQAHNTELNHELSGYRSNSGQTRSETMLQTIQTQERAIHNIQTQLEKREADCSRMRMELKNAQLRTEVLNTELNVSRLRAKEQEEKFMLLREKMVPKETYDALVTCYREQEEAFKATKNVMAGQDDMIEKLREQVRSFSAQLTELRNDTVEAGNSTNKLAERSADESKQLKAMQDTITLRNEELSSLRIELQVTKRNLQWYQMQVRQLSSCVN
ncbi:Ankyrin repeat protein 1 [Giardia muris]|uniref:Ankyrin repeat protein 1 n=1 Tax=Giardia muris TaxID=5742 RepID=A0A4Z1SW26_GIAMU|nr:Ankyrin repeat protein 1 [Giardia muris]|eukprot:TNJ29956.1 Ankyrin repeat protein 1 [Giardia muris]